MFNQHSGPSYAGLRIGLLGGSFNPAHDGHRAISLHALKRLGLDQVWWLVSPQNPLKRDTDMAPLAQRIYEARRVACHPRLVVTDLETQLRTIYTVDTLTALKQRFPRTQFVWLMGADNLRQLPHWHRWQRLLQLAPVAVFRRPTYAAGRLAGQAAQCWRRQWQAPAAAKNLARQQGRAWLVLDNRLSGLSATDIRKERERW